MKFAKITKFGIHENRKIQQFYQIRKFKKFTKFTKWVFLGWYSNSVFLVLKIIFCILVECTADWQFQCNDKKKCIDKRRRCDGYAECADKSDEADCLECKYH